MQGIGIGGSRGSVAESRNQPMNLSLPTAPTIPAGLLGGADQSVSEREHHELGARLEPQLAHDVGAMRVDGAYRHV
jgi:hypothetical protein